MDHWGYEKASTVLFVIQVAMVCWNRQNTFVFIVFHVTIIIRRQDSDSYVRVNFVKYTIFITFSFVFPFTQIIVLIVYNTWKKYHLSLVINKESARGDVSWYQSMQH